LKLIKLNVYRYKTEKELSKFDDDDDDVTENEQSSSFKNSLMFDESNRLEKECLPTQHCKKSQPQITQVFKKIQTKNFNSIKRK